MAEGSSSRARRLFRALTFCVFLPSILIELSMMVLDPLMPVGMYQYDPELGYRVRAGALGANSFGFNDDEHAIEKPRDVFRILVLGDSFAWAGGKNNYTFMLEKKLNAESRDRRLEVINAGYPMLGTLEEVALYEKYGYLFKPDLLILAFFVGNDFIESSPHRKRIIVNDTMFDIDRRTELRIAGLPITPQPRFVAFVQQKWRVLLERMFLILRQERGFLMREESFLDVEAKRLRFCLNHPEARALRSTQGAYALDAIRRLRARALSENTSFLIMMIPDNAQVDDTLLARILARRGETVADYDTDCFQEILSQFAAQERIESLDLLPAFRGAPDASKLYTERDTHWSVAGNELAADVVAKYLAPRIAPAQSPKPVQAANPAE